MGDPVIGSVLGGKYLVEGILGQGGMGVVVAARHMELDQRVAIKCLLSHAQAVPEIVERFTREARAAAKIQGEHVARVIDVGRFEDGTPFMVMEHLKGRDLADELAKVGPLPVPDAVRYVLEACEALAQAHALRIVHRDLKPSNLFLAEQPGRRAIVKVLDFGISKVIDPSGSALTKTSSVMGTPYYMSPEQLLSSKSVDERSDIWALGVILYELLVGRTPFMAETAPEVVALVLQNAPPPIASFRPDVPQRVTEIVARCMRSKVDERFPNVAELASALASFAASEDRQSALAIARVLGVPSSTATHVPSIAPQQPTMSASRSVPPGTGAPASAGTAHNLTLSADHSAVPVRKPWGAIAAGTAVLAIVGVAGVLALRRPAPASAIAAAPVSEPAPAAVTTTTQPASPVGLAPVDPPSALAAPAPSPSAAAPAAHANVAGGHGSTKHPAAAPAAASHPSAVAQPQPPATAQPPAPPAPAAPAAAPPPSNPLDMHIK